MSGKVILALSDGGGRGAATGGTRVACGRVHVALARLLRRVDLLLVIVEIERATSLTRVFDFHLELHCGDWRWDCSN